jgi:hypothetical protein
MDLDIRANSAGRIYRNLGWRVVLMSLMTVGAYGLVVFLALFIPLKDSMGVAQARAVAIPAGVVVGVAIDAGWQMFFLSQLSKSRLAIEGDTILVRGMTGFRIAEKRYAFPDLAVVVLKHYDHHRQRFGIHRSRRKTPSNEMRLHRL